MDDDDSEATESNFVDSELQNVECEDVVGSSSSSLGVDNNNDIILYNTDLPFSAMVI